MIGFIIYIDIREQLRQVEKSVLTKEPRFVFRVLRSLPNTRRRLNPVVLRRIIFNSYGLANKDKENLLNIVGGDESMDQASSLQRGRSTKQGSLAPLPEVRMIVWKLSNRKIDCCAKLEFWLQVTLSCHAVYFSYETFDMFRFLIF